MVAQHEVIKQETRKELGRTGILVSPMGLGAWQWGDRFLWKFGQGYDETDVRSAFESTLASGINFVDTAELYGLGRSERLLGKFIRDLDPIHPNSIVIATKFAPMPWRLTKGGLLHALQASINRIEVSPVDLYQIHFPLLVRSIETWMAAMAEAVRKGMTRAVGVSNFSLEQTRQVFDLLQRRGIPLASNQVEYNLLNRNIERQGLLNYCLENGISIIAYSPLAQGVLTGKYSPDHIPPGARGRKYDRQYLEKIQPLLSLMREIGQEHGGKTPAQISLNWLITKGVIPIPGAKNAVQAVQNSGALGWHLSAEEMLALEKAADNGIV